MDTILENNSSNSQSEDPLLRLSVEARTLLTSLQTTISLPQQQARLKLNQLFPEFDLASSVTLPGWKAETDVNLRDSHRKQLSEIREYVKGQNGNIPAGLRKLIHSQLIRFRISE